MNLWIAGRFNHQMKIAVVSLVLNVERQDDDPYDDQTYHSLRSFFLGSFEGLYSSDPRPGVRDEAPFR